MRNNTFVLWWGYYYIIKIFMLKTLKTILETILNIAFLLLLCFFTVYLFVAFNVAYMLGIDFSNLLSERIFWMTIPPVLCIYVYLIIALIRGVKKKTHSKKYLYAFLWFIGLGIVYYFCYFSVYDSEIIPEKDFETKLKNIQIKDSDNWYVGIENTIGSPKNIWFLNEADNIKIVNIYSCYIWKEDKICTSKQKEALALFMEKNFSWLLDINKKLNSITDQKYFHNVSESWDYTSLQWITRLWRYNLFVVIKLLESWKQQEAIETLLLYWKLSDRIIMWNSSLVWLIMWISLQSVTSDNIKYIIENYRLDNSSLLALQKYFSLNNINEKAVFDNTLNFEYQSFKRGLVTLVEKKQLRSSLLLNLDELFNERRIQYQKIKDWDYSKTDFDCYFLTRKCIDDFAWKFLWNMSFNGYLEDLKNMNKRKKELLEMINKKMKETK